MMVWPRISPICSAWMRARASTPPPGPNGTIKVIGRFGQSWAQAPPAAANRQTAAVEIAIVILRNIRSSIAPILAGQLSLGQSRRPICLAAQRRRRLLRVAHDLRMVERGEFA